MKHTKSTKGGVRAVLAAGVTVLGLAAFVAPPAQAAVGAARAVQAAGVGDYSGAASGSLLNLSVGNLTALSAAIPTVANIGVDPTSASGSTQATPRSQAQAANLNPSTLLDALSLTDIVPLSTAAAQAPPSSSSSKNFLAIPADPILNVSASDATAAANWAGDGVCVAADQPVAESTIRTAQVNVLELPAPANLTVASIDADANGAVTTKSNMMLPSIAPQPGMTDPRAVKSTQFTQTLGLDLFGNQISIQVLDPEFSATATGLPGGASIHYVDPILTVNGNQLTAATLDQNLTGPLLTALQPLLTALDAQAGLLRAVISLGQGPQNVTTTPDGTVAKADAELAHLTVSLLPVIGEGTLGTGLVIADLSLMPMHVESFAPAGGLDCGQPQNPVAVSKTADKQTVQPGETFTYSITVSNTSQVCDLADVRVEDQLTGPAGSTVAGTNPTADSTTWPTVVWNNVGTIPAGGSKLLTVTVQVPKSAQPDQTYGDTATASGTCNGTRYDGSFKLDGIPKVVLGLLPRTGGESTLPLLGAAMLAMGYLALRRLRRA